MDMVESIWKEDYGKSIMKKVWCMLMDLQHVLKQLNRKEFKYFGKQIEMDRLEIAKVQDQLCKQATDDLILQEKELLIKLEKWSMIEESALRQKSWIKWIQLGDANNKFFSSVIKERTQNKQIRNILSMYGNMLYEPHEIQDEFVMFYKSLMGTSASNQPAINTQVMKRGPTLTKQQRLQLCAAVTEQEIYDGLKSIGNDKAQGLGGYNAFILNILGRSLKGISLRLFRVFSQQQAI